MKLTVGSAGYPNGCTAPRLLSIFLSLGALSLLAAGLAARQSFVPIRFEDTASKSGISFILHNCPTPEKHLIETMAGGVAVFDYDGDGRPDMVSIKCFSGVGQLCKMKEMPLFEAVSSKRIETNGCRAASAAARSERAPSKSKTDTSLGAVRLFMYCTEPAVSFIEEG